MLNLYPVPQKIELLDGVFNVAEPFFVLYPAGDEMFEIVRAMHDRMETLADIACSLIPDCRGKLNIGLSFEKLHLLHGEEYEIYVGSDGIRILFGEPVGAFRAVTTFLQIVKKCGRRIPFVHIHDFPDLRVRGYMLDISRGKVPTLETLYALVDMLADLKINQLQMYLENLSYEYSNFPELFNVIDPLSPFEVCCLDEYCKKRYIELVPNQNSFAHMGNWTSHFSHLDASENGSGIFNPIGKDVEEHLRKMYDSLLPAFSSRQVNVGCDEVEGLEKGKAKEECERIGVANVFKNYVLMLYDIVSGHGHRMQMWADILMKYQEIVPELPRSIIPVVWGYNRGFVFDDKCAYLTAHGFDFIIAPGASTWGSMFFDAKTAAPNIQNAVRAAKKYRGLGILLTDWGDFGHMPFSFSANVPIVYSGGVAWNCDGCEDFSLAQDYADRELYKCEKGSLSRFIADVGTIDRNRGGWSENLKDSWYLPFDEYEEKVTPDSIDADKNSLFAFRDKLDKLVFSCHDADLLRAEVELSIDIMLYTFDFRRIKYEYRDMGSVENIDERCDALEKRISVLTERFIALWNRRNKPAGGGNALRTMKQRISMYREAAKH